MSTNMVGTLFSARKELDGTADIIISYTDIAYGYKTVETLLQSTGPFNVIVDSKWRELWEGRMEVCWLHSVVT
jgi:choline kinase